MNAISRLDTSCDDGLWISPRLVHELGLGDKVSDRLAPIRLSQPNRQLMESDGSVRLRWGWREGDTRARENDFYVMRLDPLEYVNWDLMIGYPYIRDNRLLSINGSISSLTSTSRPTTGKSF